MLEKFLSARGKGRLGELRVSLAARRAKNGKSYILNDFLLEHNGSTAQIDHIIINKNGVFVIETKNYEGNIVGEDKNDVWVRYRSALGGRIKEGFYSPVKQVLAHTARLEQALEGKVYLVPVVVFVNGNIARVRSQYTITLKALGAKLALPHRVPTYTVAEMKEIYLRLKGMRGDKAQKRKHIEGVIYRQRLVKNNICPRCGRILVKRKSEYGEFYGCQGYPECNYIKK